MMRTLGHLRDYLSEQALKFLPGNLQSGHFILLRESGRKNEIPNKLQFTEEDKQHPAEIYHTVIHVFDNTGTFLGTITHPDFWPSND